MAAETPSSIVLSCFPPVAAEPLVHSIFFAKSLIHPKWHFYALVFFNSLLRHTECRAIAVSFALLAFCSMVNGDVKDASEFGALGSLRKALVERKRGQCLVASSTLDMAGCYFFSACFSETKESLPTFPQPAQQIELLNGREINYYYFPFPTNISLSNKYFSNMTSNYFPFPTNISPCNF